MNRLEQATALYEHLSAEAKDLVDSTQCDKPLDYDEWATLGSLVLRDIAKMYGVKEDDIVQQGHETVMPGCPHRFNQDCEGCIWEDSDYDGEGKLVKGGCSFNPDPKVQRSYRRWLTLSHRGSLHEDGDDQFDIRCLIDQGNTDEADRQMYKFAVGISSDPD